jgi:hypothetical protein
VGEREKERERERQLYVAAGDDVSQRATILRSGRMSCRRRWRRRRSKALLKLF